MNAKQIDPVSSPSSSRIVGYADGAELKANLAQGFLCGPWSKKRKAYAVMRKPKRPGQPPPVTEEQKQEGLTLLAEIDQRRSRLLEIAFDAGLTKDQLAKYLHRLRRQQ